MVRKIMWANLGIYMATVLGTLLLSVFTLRAWMENLLLTHPSVTERGKVWTVATYAWFHDLGRGALEGQSVAPLLSVFVCGAAAYGIVRLYQSAWGRREFFLFLLVAFIIIQAVSIAGFGAPLHLAGNLLGLYFFGHIFEERWGPKRFLNFWFLCTVGGGVFSTLVYQLIPTVVGDGPVLGASAGVLGLLAAFSIYFPEKQVLFGLLVPIKGKHFLWIVVAFDLLSLLAGSNVAVFAHFGGIIAAALLCTGYWRPSKIMAKLSDARNKKSHLRLVMPDEEDDDEKPRRYLH
jgi:hypothetical protein